MKKALMAAQQQIDSVFGLGLRSGSDLVQHVGSIIAQRLQDRPAVMAEQSGLVRTKALSGIAGGHLRGIGVQDRCQELGQNF
jgi:hypothetical protein